MPRKTKKRSKKCGGTPPKTTKKDTTPPSSDTIDKILESIEEIPDVHLSQEFYGDNSRTLEDKLREIFQKSLKQKGKGKYGGENTSSSIHRKRRAAKRIQSRFRGNKGRIVAKRKKEQKEVDDFREIINRNLVNTGELPDDVMRNIISRIRGRGKKKKSKKLTNKKSKSRSKRGG